MEKSKIISGCEVLLIGGSAGSIEVLMKLLPRLEIPTFAIVIVLHRKNAEDLLLEELFALKTRIPVKEVEDKTVLLPGYIYVVPSDYHLLFETNNLLSLDVSEKVNYSRPSIDVVFESAAEVYREKLVAILLSGANADGTHGLQVIKKNEGVVVVQKPETAEMPFMPQHAIDNLTADYILDIDELLKFILAINSVS